MRLTRRALLQAGGGALLGFQTPARAQGVTEEQLKALLPDERDLTGFVRVRPEGEVPRPPTFSRTERRWVQTPSPATEIPDEVGLNVDQTTLGYGRKRIVSSIARGMYSEDGVYRLAMVVRLCDSPDTARGQIEQIRQSSSGVWEQGAFGRSDRIGDESWVLPGGGVTSFNHLMYRAGKVMVVIHGSRSRVATEKGVRGEFPPAAVESVAHLILLRAARQADLTGIPARSVTLVVNGKPLPAGAALALGDTVYVSVNEFARLAGMQSRWNTGTGSLTLEGAARKPVTLAAGSASAAVAGGSSAALKTPLLKEAGKPVMALQDLLPLVKGRIISRQGDRFEVKVQGM